MVATERVVEVVKVGNMYEPIDVNEKNCGVYNPENDWTKGVVPSSTPWYDEHYRWMVKEFMTFPTTPEQYLGRGWFEPTDTSVPYTNPCQEVKATHHIALTELAKAKEEKMLDPLEQRLVEYYGPAALAGVKSQAPQPTLDRKNVSCPKKWYHTAKPTGLLPGDYITVSPFSMGYSIQKVNILGVVVYVGLTSQECYSRFLAHQREDFTHPALTPVQKQVAVLLWEKELREKAAEAREKDRLRVTCQQEDE